MSDEHFVAFDRLEHINERGQVVLSKRGQLGERYTISIGSYEHDILNNQRYVSYKMVMNRTCSTLDCGQSVLQSFFLTSSDDVL